MTAGRVAVITCDGCRSPWIGDSISITVARATATDQSGWLCDDTGDWCTSCRTPALPDMGQAPIVSVAVPPGHDIEPRSLP